MPVEQPFNVYREQLSSLYHGLALWKPCPEGLYDRVAIGDVGYISDGAFIRMFNVTLPWDNASNKTLGVPNHYDLLNSGEFTTRCENFGKLEYYSRHVSREENTNNAFAVIPEQTEGVTYKCRGRGALLFLPHGGHREEAIHMKVFEKYIRDHVVNWFNWSRDIGLPVERMEDIVLVYGCAMVSSWAAAAFDDYAADAQVSLTSRTLNNGGTSFIWSNVRGTVEFHNSQLDNGSPARKNHCVFIKCFRAKRILFWTRHLQAAAEPLPDDPDNSQDGEIQVTQFQNVSNLQDCDPLIGILDYITEKCLKDDIDKTEMAITHHDDLQLIKDVGILTADAVRQFLTETDMPLRFADGATMLQHPLDEHEDFDVRPGTSYGASTTVSRGINAFNFLSPARKLIQKSLRLDEAPSSSSSSPSDRPPSSAPIANVPISFTSATETHPTTSGTKRRKAPNRHIMPPLMPLTASMKEENQEYTAEDLAVVERVRTRKVTDYYEILAIKRECDEADVKKAYRTLALALHPDKNRAPGADEAFKMVSKAFQVLSDPQKREIYDDSASSGGDPESRFSEKSVSGPSSGFPTDLFGDAAFRGELSPEDLFNTIFDEDSGFGADPAFPDFGLRDSRTNRVNTRRARKQKYYRIESDLESSSSEMSSSGPSSGFPINSSGVGAAVYERGRSHASGQVWDDGFKPASSPKTNVRTQGAQPQERQQKPAAPRSLVRLRYLLFALLGLFLTFALLKLFAKPHVADPSFSFEASVQFNSKRTTQRLGVQYHVNSAEFSRHPIAAEIAWSERGDGPQSMPALRRFEENVVQAFTRETSDKCQRGLDSKQQQMVRAYEGGDWEMVRQIEAETIESCEALKQRGLKPPPGATNYADSIIALWRF